MKNVLGRVALCGAALLVAAAALVVAQEPVAALQDLVGLRGSAGESALEQRGYDHLGGKKAGASSYTYWRESSTGKCVSVRVAEGRFDAIVHVPRADCAGFDSTGSGGGESSAAGQDPFDTVCGVIADGKTHRYRCEARNEGCQGEGYCRTIVTYPDNELRISWLANDRIEVAIEGLAPVKTTSAFENGQTRFEMDGKTYFVYRNRDRAKRELAKLRQ